MTRDSNHWRGHPITKVGDLFHYEDGTLVRDDPNRPCGHCGLPNTSEGHDGCLGTLPNVMNACCGHGDESAAYVQFDNGAMIRGAEAIQHMPSNP